MSGRTIDLAAWSAAADDADRLFAALESPRRHDAIAELARRDTPADLSDLASTLAGSSDHPDEERVAIRLWHVDLPKLADLGLVTLDYEARTAELTPDGRRAASVAARPGTVQ
ncbi:hypothetical protein G9464_14890 [Halostella sp. JP-L12]|uniref:DUF7344 domain-containing protein n=1 Tax=Halostella TaxID=1843185 RepID=UPI0013CE7496|nr:MULTISPECIES: hypothetical protein [Halostella]NHN48873.1 hypothetical protein [Halostella sp. JP-L12]